MAAHIQQLNFKNPTEREPVEIRLFLLSGRSSEWAAGRSCLSWWQGRLAAYRFVDSRKGKYARK